MTPTVHIGIRAPQALADALKDVAAMRGTTLSLEVRRALLAHAERHANALRNDDAPGGTGASVEDTPDQEARCDTLTTTTVAS